MNNTTKTPETWNGLKFPIAIIDTSNPCAYEQAEVVHTLAELGRFVASYDGATAQTRSVEFQNPHRWVGEMRLKSCGIQFDWGFVDWYLTEPTEDQIFASWVGGLKETRRSPLLSDNHYFHNAKSLRALLCDDGMEAERAERGALALLAKLEAN